MSAIEEIDWNEVSRQLQGANNMEELIQVRLKTPGTTRKQAWEWAADFANDYLGDDEECDA